MVSPTTTSVARSEPAPPEVFANGSPRSTAAADVERSDQLERIAQEADRHSRHGCELAGRGAFFAARAEFLAALQLLAEGLDTEYKTSTHSHALAAAWTAMKEADDFLPRRSGLEASVDLPRILDAHNTAVLKGHAEGLTPLAALKGYFTFAQEQFAAAVGHEVAGSMALHGLGKLHSAITANKTIHVLAAEPKAMAYYQAALMVDSGNFLAANDLGVLLARYGNYVGARAALEYSLAIHPQSVGWQNLSVVYRQLAEPALAAQAWQRAGQTRQAEVAQRRGMPTGSPDKVRWLDPAAFAETSTNTPNSPAAITPSTPQVAAQPAAPSSPRGSAQPATSTPAVGWFPWGSQDTRR
jgi:tetratricopeptide (TPR) repeat protein